MSEKTEQSVQNACCETDGSSATCCDESTSNQGQAFAELRQKLIACLDGCLNEMSKSSAGPEDQGQKSVCCCNT